MTSEFQVNISNRNYEFLYQYNIIKVKEQENKFCKKMNEVQIDIERGKEI